MAGHSSHQPGDWPLQASLRTVRPDGTPVYRYQETSGVPPIDVARFDHTAADRLPGDHRHIHDFLVLVYVERGGGSVRIDGVAHPLADGRAYAVAPGRVLGTGALHSLKGSRGWAAYFMPDAFLGARGAASPLAWADHPLLSGFAPELDRSDVDGLVVPVADRARWSQMFSELQDEVAARGRTGFREAASAALTLLLVAFARLAESSGRSPGGDPLVSRVFGLVEQKYQEPISTRDVAAELGYTTGHLTTLVRERTGRTVLDWITERRLLEARRLLAETDLSFDAVARRSGLRDAGYLGRRFRARYGTSPQAWRRSQRSVDPDDSTAVR
jgi:AraC-like DNA-binding protein